MLSRMDNQDGNGPSSVLLPSGGHMLPQRQVGHILPTSVVQTLSPLRPPLTLGSDAGVEMISKRPRMVSSHLDLRNTGPELAVDTNIGLKKVVM